jgi:hypothetical protein
LGHTRFKRKENPVFISLARYKYTTVNQPSMGREKSSTDDIAAVVETSEEEYRSHEFCRDVPCRVQLDLESHQKGSKMYEQAKTECKDRCRYSRISFISWLLEHGYSVLGADHEEAVGQETAYEYHKRLQSMGCRIVRRQDG